MPYQIRPMRPDEYPLLDDFLYEAIFLPEGVEPPPRDIILDPALQVYVQGFGTAPADRCLCAEADGKVVGAVWIRLMDDYGHLYADTPSLAISLYPDYRAQGIGTALMQAMLGLAAHDGFPQISLSVQKENYAVRMYQKVGFQTVRETDEEYLMLWRAQKGC
ncbi:MAG: GNAT family N-acetyltransferase [Oscillospiraceae bacterium]|nr:GNAT family N-acetyltransferase [Oscillospiraceae bacterium]